MAFFQAGVDSPPVIPKPSPGSGSTTGGQSGGTNASIVSNNFQVASGLYDVTNQQYALTFQPGVLNQWYRYVGPTVNMTDTFTGSIALKYAGTTTQIATVTVTAVTLPQLAADIMSEFGTYCNAYAVQQGTTGYLVIESPSSSSANPAATQDAVLTITSLSLTDNADPYLQFQFVPFISTALGLQSQSAYQWAWAIRDTISGHLSNLSPLATIQLLNFPSEVNLTITATLTATQVVEVYRTASGGAILLFLGYATGSNPTYTFRDTFNDAFLNSQLVGPIDEANDPPPIGLTDLVAHQGHLWGFVGNKVYFSGGPDTTNGSGNEAWPPSNYFSFPGNVVTLKSTDSGLAVFLTDDVHLIRGVDSASFFPGLWMAGFGVTFPGAVDYDGQTLYVYTTKQQLHAMSRSAQDEIGFPIGDQLLANFPAASTTVTLHRGSSTDYALYVSNGSSLIARFDPRMKAWSPMSQPLVGAGRVKSLETSIGVTTLLLGAPSQVFARKTTIWQDNGTPYSAFATIGTMQVADPGTVTTLSNIAMQLQPRGTAPQVFVLFNEINPAVVPFTQLLNPVNDPPDLQAAQTLWAYRWYTKATQTPLALWLNTVQVKIQFATENAQNEVLGVYLRPNA